MLQGDVIPHIVVSSNEADSEIYEALQTIFFAKLYQEHPNCASSSCNDPFFHGMSLAGYRISIHINVFNPSESTTLNLKPNESYELKIMPPKKGQVIYVAEIKASSYFGARHGIETLNQLITYNEITDSLQTYKWAHIVDEPVYPYRGVMIDAARNWISVQTLKKIIDGLGYNKLNVLHWHLTDAESFPFQTKDGKLFQDLDFKLSELSKWGSYSTNKVYSTKEITDIVQYAKIRGVKVIPEIGGPGHVYSGWELVEKEYPDLGKILLCDNTKTCATPPCGQVIRSLNCNLTVSLFQYYSCDSKTLFST